MIGTTSMLADIGTRRGVKIQDIDENSDWINGYPWMKLRLEEMPIRSVKTVKLNNESEIEAKVEIPYKSIVHINHSEKKLPDELIIRYQFSNYLIDPNRFRFAKVIRILAHVIRFVKILRKQISNKMTNPIQVFSTEINDAETYFFKKATLEVKKFNKKRFYEKFTIEKNEILYYSGRILPSDDVSVAGRLTEAMIDLTSSTFFVPVIDKHSPLAYSIINDIHWNNDDVKHSGVDTVWREVLKTSYIIEGRSIVKKFRKMCERCRYLNKKTIQVMMGPISKHNMTIAPPFYITQVDLAGPFPAFSQHNKRTTVKVWMAVFCCNTTSTINIKIMEDYSSNSFIQAFIRLSCEVGYPKMLLPDEGSQLLKSCEVMQFDYNDIKRKLYLKAKVEFDVCPVGGHNMHGKVERKIQEIKKSIEKTCSNERLSIIQWETLGAEIANSANDMPLGLGNDVSDVESIDLITPNRLKIGRNNSRSPDGILDVTCKPEKFISLNIKIFNSWFENWLMCHLPKLMYHPKWFSTTHHLRVDDIVLILKQDSNVTKKYQFGRVTSVNIDKDGRIRKANVRFRNHNENFYRETYRAVRELVVIHSIDDIDIMKDLDEFSKIANEKINNLSP